MFYYKHYKKAQSNIWKICLIVLLKKHRNVAGCIVLDYFRLFLKETE